MDRLNDVARLLIASCALASDQQLPRETAVLSKALQRMKTAGAFPDWFWDQLHFADSGTGGECVELQTLLRRAQDLELTSVSNPSYTRVNIEISSYGARFLLELVEPQVTVSEARSWGKDFRAAIVSFEEEKNKFQKTRTAGMAT